MSLRENLNLLLTYLGMGYEITLPGGQVLLFEDGGEEPGFKATVKYEGQKEAIVMMIGSDIAWMTLVSHAKHLSELDIINMELKIGLTEKYRGSK